MDYILELDQVSKRFPKDGFVLDRVSFSLPYGAVMGLVGQNGAGKTTAIGCILNTSSRDGGTIRLFGQEMGDQDTAIREKIGVVYDGDNFPGYLTAAQLSDCIRRGTLQCFKNICRIFTFLPDRRLGPIPEG